MFIATCFCCFINMQIKKICIRVWNRFKQGFLSRPCFQNKMLWLVKSSLNNKWVWESEFQNLRLNCTLGLVDITDYHSLILILSTHSRGYLVFLCISFYIVSENKYPRIQCNRVIPRPYPSTLSGQKLSAVFPNELKIETKTWLKIGP